MKSPKLLCASFALMCLDSAMSQPAPPSRPLNALTPAPAVARAASGPTLTRFDLDFPGGTPRELVAAIQKAMGKPLNAIVPDEFANTKLPALKMNNVNVPELFQALEESSLKREVVPVAAGTGSYTSYQASKYGFRKGELLSDDTIWSFYVEKPNYPGQPSAKICRFYSLAAYLERGATVDDITTAIETGARMLGEASGPEIRFHKDTKLLIAVGDAGKLEIVDAVLRALDSGKPATGRSGRGTIISEEPVKSEEKANPPKR